MTQKATIGDIEMIIKFVPASKVCHGSLFFLNNDLGSSDQVE